MLDYLRDLGVTAIELLPVHQFLHDGPLLERGLTNYWGYNTLGFFAPHRDYSAVQTLGGAVAEFKTMVRKLHAAGIEVILDVVYNHTCESHHQGPTVSWRAGSTIGPITASIRRSHAATPISPGPATR